MGKLKKTWIILAIFCISQIIFSGFAFVSPMLVINNTGNNAKILPMRKWCQQIINNCAYPIGILMYPSSATKSFFENKPSCVVLSECVKTIKCPGTLPTNTEWNTSSNYVQTFDGFKWVPTKTAHYDATPASDDCRYDCKTNYSWNGTSCIADTRTYTCAAKPIGTVRNTVGNYLQTWNGTTRTPLDSTTSYSTTVSTNSCKYKCDVWYRWDTTTSSCINTCALPWWWWTKTHWETITAYDKTSGTCTTNNCASETRTCNGALWTFDWTYQYASCTQNANTQSCVIANGVGTQSCTAWSTSRWTCNVVSCNAGYRASWNTCVNTCALPWWGTITNGQSVTAYDKTSGTCTTNNCASETRTCNGTLWTLNGTYQYASCTPNANTQSCIIANGVGTQSCTAWSTSRWTCTLVSCNAGYRPLWNTCINTCTLPWWWTITDGQPVTAYDKTSGTCPTNNCASQIRVCNGTLWTLNGTYTYQNCTANANTQSCTVSNGWGNQSCAIWSTSRWSCIVNRCTTDYYDDGWANDCVHVGNWYYSNSTSTTRTACTNYPDTASRNYTYTSAGNGTNSCTATYTELCWLDLYENPIGVCSAVGNWYFSPINNNSRTLCTNYPDTASRDYTYTSDGNGANSCTATYTELCWLDLYETSNWVCSAVGNWYFSPINNNSRTLCTNYPDTASRDYTYTSDGNGANSCTATYTELCWVDLYETSNWVCSAVGNWYFSPANNNNRTSCTNKPSYSTYTTDGNGTNTCSRTCDTWYHTEDGVTCISNTKTTSCTGKPLGTTYYTATDITQTWNTSLSAWLPSAVATYSTTASTTECRYTCAAWYLRNGSSCVAWCKTNSDCSLWKICQWYVAPTRKCLGTQLNNWSCSQEPLPWFCDSEDSPCSTYDTYYDCQDTDRCHLGKPGICNRNWTSCIWITSQTTCSATAWCSVSNTSSEVFWTCVTPTPVCGNDIVEIGETCDWGSQSCSIGGVAGTQLCNNTCSWYGTCLVSPCIASYNTDVCWWCKWSWTMSSCDNRECTPDGLEDAIWNCSYAWITKQCYSVLGDPCNTSTCFTSGTQVKTADGISKNIENIQIGDELLGQDDQINTVIAYDRPNLGERKLYSINNGPYFVTHEHPFMTIWWWKSISPEATRREMPNFEILPLKVGDILIKENNEIEYIWSIQSTTADPEIPLYNFKLDGNNTYYANGYLVHNKLYDWDGCTLSSQCACGSCVGWVCCPTGGGWCFKEWTQVRLPDGTTTAIENIQTGNIVLWSENTQNTVLKLFKIWNNNWDLYAINNSDYFVTDTHPFMTTEGWKSLNPVWSSKENPGMIFWQLEIGDILITEQGTTIIYSLEKTAYAWYVYNFRLDGNKTYYADWYLVHNVEIKSVE